MHCSFECRLSPFLQQSVRIGVATLMNDCVHERLPIFVS